jgi:hypothetical protein
MFHPALAGHSFMRIIISFHVFEITKTGGSFILNMVESDSRALPSFKHLIKVILTEKDGK